MIPQQVQQQQQLPQQMQHTVQLPKQHHVIQQQQFVSHPLYHQQIQQSPTSTVAFRSERRYSEQLLRPVQQVRLGSLSPLQNQTTVQLLHSPPNSQAATQTLVYMQPHQIQQQQPIQQQVFVKNVVQSPSPQRIVKQQILTSMPSMKTIQVVQQQQQVPSVTPNVSIADDSAELDALRKKVANLEAIIAQLKSSGNVTKITEIHLEETLVENRNLTIQNGELHTQISLLKQQMDQLNLRLNQLSLFETEYGKIQDLYNQQLQYAEQLKAELFNKQNALQELQARDAMSQLQIQDLNKTIEEMRDNQDDQVKRSKKAQQDKEKEQSNQQNHYLTQLEEKDNEIQNILFLLSNAEAAKTQWDYQSQAQQAQINALENDLRNKDDMINMRNSEIERLQKQCHQLQLNVHGLGNIEVEKARLQQALDSKNAEIEQWRNQSQQQQLTIEDLRNQNSKIYALENKIVQLTVEIERLRSQLDTKDEEVKRSRNRQGELEKDVDEKRGLQGQLASLEAKLKMYANELEQMSRVLEAKQNECEEQRQKLNQLYILQFSVQQHEATIQNLQQKNGQLEAELQAMRETCYNLEVENNKMNKSLQEAQAQVAALTNEVSQLKAHMNDYLQVRQSVSEYEYKLLQLNSNIAQLNQALAQKTAEADQWRGQWSQASDENEKVKKAANKLNGDLKAAETQQQQIKDLQALVADLTGQNEQLRSKLIQWEMKYEELVRKTTMEKEQWENKLAMLSMENQRKDYMLQAKEKDLENLRQQLVGFTDIQIQFRQNQDKIQFLLTEIERITAEKQQIAKEAESWRAKYLEISHLEYKAGDLLGRLVLTCAEVETLREVNGEIKQENHALRNKQQQQQQQQSQPQSTYLPQSQVQYSYYMPIEQSQNSWIQNNLGTQYPK